MVPQELLALSRARMDGEIVSVEQDDRELLIIEQAIRYCLSAHDWTRYTKFISTEPPEKQANEYLLIIINDIVFHQYIFSQPKNMLRVIPLNCDEYRIAEDRIYASNPRRYERYTGTADLRLLLQVTTVPENSEIHDSEQHLINAIIDRVVYELSMRVDGEVKTQMHRKEVARLSLQMAIGQDTTKRKVGRATRTGLLT